MSRSLATKNVDQLERGSITFEVILLTPLLFALMLFAAFLGNTARIQVRVDRAVHNAARAASYKLEAQEAKDAAVDSLNRELGSGLCNASKSDTTNVGYEGENSADTGLLTIRVVCRVRFPLFGSTRTISAVAVEAVDDYRSRLKDPNDA